MTFRKRGSGWRVRAELSLTVGTRKEAEALDRLARSALAGVRRGRSGGSAPCATIRDRLDEFIRDSVMGLRRRACGEETARRHRGRLLAFDRAFHSKPLDAVAPSEVEGWIARRVASGVDRDTVNADLVSLYAFTRWAQGKKYAPDVVPLLAVGRLRTAGKIPGANRKPPKALEGEDALGVITRIMAVREDIGLVLLGMFLFGLRPAALCSLRRRDVRLPTPSGPGALKSGALKGHFEQSLPIERGSAQHRWAEACVRLAGRRRGGQSGPGAPFIICIGGRGRINPGGWTTGRLCHALRRVCAGLGIEYTSYRTRHSVISWLIGQAGVSLGAAQRLAGHARATTTNIYNQRANRDAVPAYGAVSEFVLRSGLFGGAGEGPGGGVCGV